jgi:glyoxylate reductase
MKKILIGMNIPKDIADRYSDRYELIYPEAPKDKFTPEEVIERIKDVHGFIGNPLRKDAIDVAENLVIASSTGAGYDAIDHIYAGSKGVWVMNAPNGTTEPTAELTITIMLCLTRRILNFNKNMKAVGKCIPGGGAFAGSFDNAAGATPAFGKTIGIIGFGKIGKAVARKARGLGMKVQYYDVFRASEEVEKQIGVTFVSFEELLKTSDYVTIHTFLSPETKGMMGAEQFKMMKKTAYFINAGRGPLMDEKALIEAVKNKEILGAALDVYEYEPEVSPELFEMDEVVLTPHIGTATRESRINMLIEGLEGISAQLSGGESPTIVNREYFVAK